MKPMVSMKGITSHQLAININREHRRYPGEESATILFSRDLLTEIEELLEDPLDEVLQTTRHDLRTTRSDQEENGDDDDAGDSKNKRVREECGGSRVQQIGG